jgi:hypothetical protein
MCNIYFDINSGVFYYVSVGSAQVTHQTRSASQTSFDNVYLYACASSNLLLMAIIMFIQNGWSAVVIYKWNIYHAPWRINASARFM